MTKKIDPHLSSRLREESEDSKNDPYPPRVAGSRPNRRYSRAEEQEESSRGANANQTTDAQDSPDQD